MSAKWIFRRGESVAVPENTPAACAPAAERRTDCMDCGLPENV